ncbi:hypothetical protein I3760_02G063000 [Carya illinoinensis]|nr:hypothetical protein I3760_02G063000 [Carya illinoinensis]
MAAVRGIDGPMLAANSCSFADLVSAVPHPIPDVHLAPKAHKTMDGEVYFLFSKEEIVKSAEPFRFSLVLKFLRQRPSLDAIRIFIKSRWGLYGIVVVSAMRKPRNVFVRLTSEEDFNKTFLREVCDINGVAYRPLTSPIGKFIRTDNSTRCATRTDGARVCLEVDVAKSPLLSFWIGAPSCPASWLQEIVYETMPAFCSICKVQGHNFKTCKKGVLRKDKEKQKVWLEYKIVSKQLKDVESSGLNIAIQEVADQCTSDAMVVGSVEHIVDTEDEKVEDVQLVELQGHDSDDKATDGNAEAVCSVSEVMVLVNSEVLEMPCSDSVEVVLRAMECSEMSKESPMVCTEVERMGAGIEAVMGNEENASVPSKVHVQSITEEPGLVPVDVSQEALVSIVVAHAEKVRDHLFVEPIAEKVLIGVSNDQLASLSDMEMGEGKTALQKDVSSDLDIRDVVKEKGEDGHKKTRSSKRVITRASKLNL